MFHARFYLIICFIALTVPNIHSKTNSKLNYDEIKGIEHEGQRRHLQFESMFDVSAGSGVGVDSNTGPERKKRKRQKKKGAKSNNKFSRDTQMERIVEDFVVGAERYHMWWKGSMQSSEQIEFTPASWSVSHNVSSNAIFTAGILEYSPKTINTNGGNGNYCQFTEYLKAYIFSLRRYYEGDIVIVISEGSLNDEAKKILKENRVVVYVVAETLCGSSTDGKSYYCGTQEERVPLSAFKYYFFELWATVYHHTSFILATAFVDTFFQSNPFHYHLSDWYPDNQMAVYQDFHPNRVIHRYKPGKLVLSECYGESSSAIITMKSRIAISTAAFMATRDGALIFSRQITTQIQEAPGRMIETRCLSGTIDFAFLNYLVYNSKMRKILPTRVYPHGEGAINPLDGLKQGNFTGSLKDFWHLIQSDNNDKNRVTVLNWNGEKSPIVNGLEFFAKELALGDNKKCIYSSITEK